MLKTEKQQQQQHVYYRLSVWLLEKRGRDEFTFGWNDDLAELKTEANVTVLQTSSCGSLEEV